MAELGFDKCFLPCSLGDRSHPRDDFYPDEITPGQGRTRQGLSWHGSNKAPSFCWLTAGVVGLLDRGYFHTRLPPGGRLKNNGGCFSVLEEGSHCVVR